MDYLQSFWLAALQGFTEFLPISSSGHLILVPRMLGWSDQGLAFDVAVHVGTLIAVLFYFRTDIRWIVRDCWLQLKGQPQTDSSRLGWMILLAALIIIPFAVFLESWIEGNMRSVAAVAATTVFFGLLLGFADKTGTQARTMDSLRWKDALIIGVAQVLALFPGTSRSGITITAGLLLGLNRQTAARFSFLLAIPVIVFAGVWESWNLVHSPQTVHWGELIFSVGVAAIVALLSIHFFLRFIDKFGLIPFVIYRVILGVALLVFYT
ncbi:MAG: undecaprenyl-diphosphate phosphatase [Pseudomonadota bacterium]